MATRRRNEEILQSMLTERTPTSILDSGGAYGYHFEDHRRTAEIGDDAWESENPPARLEDGRVIISLYAYLLEKLDFAEEEDQKFQSFCEERDVAGLTAQHAYLDFLREVVHGEKLYSFHEGWEPEIINSYNGDCSLDQTIQFFVWTEPEYGDAFICLSIHGGCDVRGGYTHPRIFQVGDRYNEPTDFLRWNDVGMMCDLCDASWHSDNGGYDWYPDGRGNGRVKGDTLKQRVVITIDEDGDEDVEVLDEYVCPCCEDGTLAVAFW